MSRTKRSTRKFKSRKQNNHRQKKTRHTKYRKHRKHGKISKRNKSKRKSRKIFFWGGGPTREQNELHQIRFEYIYEFMKLLKNKNLLIPCRILESPFKELLCSNTWNDIFRTEIINQTLNIKYKLYDNTNYYRVIKRLTSIIDNEKMNQAISNNSIFNEQIETGNIQHNNEIPFFNNSPIIYMHNKDNYMYILLIDDTQTIYKMELPQAQPQAEEEAAAKQAEEEEAAAAKQAQEEAAAAAKARGKARLNAIRERRN